MDDLSAAGIFEVKLRIVFSKYCSLPLNMNIYIHLCIYTIIKRTLLTHFGNQVYSLRVVRLPVPWSLSLLRIPSGVANRSERLVRSYFVGRGIGRKKGSLGQLGGGFSNKEKVVWELRIQ